MPASATTSERPDGPVPRLIEVTKRFGPIVAVELVRSPCGGWWSCRRRLGITVLLVTHDQVEALSVSDRIAVMRAGHIEQIGPPQEIYDSPVSAAVRDFVGRAVVLEGAISRLSDAETSVTLDGGGQVICRGPHPEPLRVGDRCQVGLRPEHIHVGGPEATEVPNSLAGKIAALLFVGDRYEARIAFDIGQEVFAYLSAADRWREDQRVTLRLRPEDLRLWHRFAAP